MDNLWFGQVLMDNKGEFVTIELKTGTTRTVEVTEINAESNTVSCKSNSALEDPDYFVDIKEIAAIDTAVQKTN